MAYVLGIDLGTTNIKAVLADAEGRTRGVFRDGVSYDRSGDGRCELPADRFRSACIRAVAGVCERADVDAREIDGVGYASQANSFLLLDGDGAPLTPVVSWQDSHVEQPDPAVRRLWDRDDFLETTGLGIWTPELAVVKVAELRDLPLWRRAASVFTVSDYLVYLLTGERVGDASTASMLGLYDVKHRCWWSEALDAVGVSEEMLARPLTPGARAGSVSREAAASFGLRSGVPVFAGGLDHYIAAVGSGAETLAEACESTGTVVACIVTGDDVHPIDGGCLGPAIDGEYLLTFDSAGGSVLERYRAERCPDRSFAELDGLAEAAGCGAGGTVASIGEDGAATFDGGGTVGGGTVGGGTVGGGTVGGGSVGGGTVGGDTVGAGSIVGDGGAAAAVGPVGSDARVGFEVRAILEATALRLRNLLVTAGMGVPRSVVSTGGGAKSEVWTQIKSSMIGSTFYTIEAEEPAAFGGAFLAARGIGVLPGDATGVPETWVSVRSIVRPDHDDRVFYERWLDQREEPCR